MGGALQSPGFGLRASHFRLAPQYVPTDLELLSHAPAQIVRTLESTESAILRLNRILSAKVSGTPGSEIKGPMAIVTPCSLLTSIALNLIVLPVLAMHHEFFARDVNGKNEMESVP